MNIWAKVLIGAGAITGVGYLIKMARTSSEIETVTSAKIHKLDLTGLTIRADVQIKNPTKGSLSIKYPFVKVLYKGAAIGTSQSIDKDIIIPSYGQARIEAIMIHVPILGLFSLGADLYKALKAGGGVKVNVRTTSTIDLGLKKLPYEKIEEIILKK